MTEERLRKGILLFFLIFVLPFLGVLAGCSPFKVIVLKDPLTPEEHIHLGVAYEKEGEFDHATKEYRLASKKLPVAFLYLGNAYFQKKEYQKAKCYYQKAIKKEPHHADAYNNLAWLYYTQHENLEEAERLALKAIELNPSKKGIYSDTLEKIRALRKLKQSNKE